jgi:amino acid permease
MALLNPSWQTICSILNTMVGGTMLTIPLLFRQSGLGTGLMVLMASGWISYKTCSLYIVHSARE